jgi:hypothetical protein
MKGITTPILQDSTDRYPWGPEHGMRRWINRRCAISATKMQFRLGRQEWVLMTTT